MIREGDLVLLYRDNQRNYLLKINKDRFHTDKGFIDTTDIIGKNFGDKITTNLNEEFYILKPTLYDLTMKVKRQTQIIYPKDIGIILMKANIFSGARIIEVGSGSGALTSALANFVRPNGKVYSYERNKIFFENTRKNLEKNNLLEWVELKNKEVIDSFDEEDVDFVMIDIGSPWELIPPAYKSLKAGYRLSTICPSFEQLTKTVAKLEETGFTNIEAMEILTRRILLKKGITRPEQRIPSHTGFLIFASKIIK
ncbi:MAG: tRNA (adenine-N1)-methyltransferase [Candidatus Omnitrophica bacterium]|nr:tRNA (adenine-N1)-methyltransferase [Candidatus Omnitrophota bacterium]MCM8826171.1 tRNA (adenine-N1)-methyltransferase [Candidatus Omnitrophota bacterium]